MSTTRTKTGVLIQITSEQFHDLQVTLAFAVAAAPLASYGKTVRRLANAINEGDRHWLPYDVPDETEPTANKENA